MGNKNSTDRNKGKKDWLDRIINPDSAEYISKVLVIGYIRRINVILPKDIYNLCVQFVGKFGIDENLVIPRSTSHELKNHWYEFTSILIQEDAELTVNRWNPDTKTGGILNIVCFGDIILEKRSTIHLDGKGYYGGNAGKTGYSCNNISTNGCNNNIGGGGSGLGSGAGGGGGYGTNGENGKPDTNNENYGIGGVTYGDKALTNLYLGSGGGGGGEIANYPRGSSGGGALRIQCFGNIIFHRSSTIQCNGVTTMNAKNGSGSGGSIHILVSTPDNIIFDKYEYDIFNDDKKKRKLRDIQYVTFCSIHAKGGGQMGNVSISSSRFGGFGGMGRICIEFVSNYKKKKFKCPEHCDITPKPYVVY